MKQRSLPGSSLRHEGAYWINGVGERCSGRRTARRTKPRAAMTRPEGGAGAQLCPLVTTHTPKATLWPVRGAYSSTAVLELTNEVIARVKQVLIRKCSSGRADLPLNGVTATCIGGELPTKTKRSQQHAIDLILNVKWTFGAGEVSHRSSCELLIKHRAKSGTAQKCIEKIVLNQLLKIQTCLGEISDCPIATKTV